MSVLSLLKGNRLLNVEKAVEAIGGSETLYENVVKRSLRVIPSRIESMDGLLEKGEDLRDFGILAHGLKGTLRQIGCWKLGADAESLESAAKADDRQYCEEHYSAFKQELLQFSGDISAIFQNADSSAASCGNISDYYDALLSSRESARDYDSISAADIISKLTVVKFGTEIDALVSEASGALESFQPEQALLSINELLTICERQLARNGGRIIMQAAPKKILVVDDDEANLTVINSMLNGLYKVYPVTSGAVALKLLEKQRPDLILLDVEMPDMSGVELFNIIKSEHDLSDVPVIFLTGNIDADSEVEAFKLGISDYIRKPVSEVIMLVRVKLHLELAELRRAAGNIK